MARYRLQRRRYGFLPQPGRGDLPHNGRTTLYRVELGQRTRCDTEVARCYTCSVPTSKARYTFTDTGELEEMLDLAQRTWPDVVDRKELLYKLARVGGASVRERERESEFAARRDRQRVALERVSDLVEVDAVLADVAWR